jgi:hypothetical protein
MTRGDGASLRTSRTASELRNSIHSAGVSRKMIAGSESIGNPRLAYRVASTGTPRQIASTNLMETPPPAKTGQIIK